MAEFRINRFRYNWRGNWASATAYKRDDVVLRTGNLYSCDAAHTSGIFSADQSTYWSVMSESSAYRGTWSNSVVYALNDIVTYGGQVYKCTVSHTSSSTFSANNDKWTLYFSSVKFRGNWTNGIRYGIGDAITLSGIVYICVAEHTAAGTLEANQSSWEIYFSNVKYRGTFNPGTRYNLNDYVKFGGSLWKCSQSYDSADDSALDFNEDFWALEIPGQQYSGLWSTDIGYGRGDIVLYGGYLYLATTSNQGQNPQTEINDWQILAKGFDFQGDWSQNASYRPGQVARRAGRLYVCTNNTIGLPAASTVTFGVTVISGGGSGVSAGNVYAIDGVDSPILNLEIGNTYRFDQTSLTNLYYANDNITGDLNIHPLNFSADNPNGDQSTGTAYVRNVVYQLDGVDVSREIYIRDFSISRSRVVSLTIDRGTPALYYYCSYHANMGGVINVVNSTNGLDPGLSADWTVLNDSSRWRDSYLDNVFYSYGDIVKFKNATYKCIVPHHSDINESYPTNGNGFDYWTTYLEGEQDNAMEQLGDLLSYGQQDDVSSLGAIPVRIGSADQVLVIQDNDILAYETLGEVVNLRYVAKDGLDELDRGRTPDKPWASIRYALIQAQKITGLVTIHVATGEYDEICPMIVPAKTAILCEELRSVTIRASSAIPELTNDSAYTEAALAQLKNLLPSIINNTAITPLSGNTQTQIRYLEAGSAAAAISMQDKIDDIIQYIKFYIDSIGSDVSVTGNNTRVADETVHQAIAVVRANYEFLAYQISSFISISFPAYAFDPVLYRTNVKDFLDAIIYDVEYPGNYKSILAARWYKNSVLGSTTEDMFYFRDASGLRNCTLKGLTGSLNPPGVFELYQLPTGGVYCSLDPGWGPDDQSTWITTRSPYIQGVTTIGNNCVGQKIDGALHNGGNRSIVSNDFTQVISDGVGAWVLNNGRAELVSVFTYYAQVGYLSTSGGVIRALNGNCSYGTFGAYAQGRDISEIPRTANVFTRNQQAIVASTFAGEFSNSIQIFEWSNAGQDYSAATFTVTGNGINVQIEGDEIRDRAVFQSRLIPLDDSTSLGGGGYLLVGNNAQVGDGSTTITLASNDGNTITEYQGMRIIITAGVGTGQYGYINAYDDITKIATIYKESTDTPGWDHIISGFPLVNTFSTNTVYRIEPRPIYTAPDYSAAQANMFSSFAWNSVSFGKFNGTYTATAPLGSGTSPAAATFSVNVSNKKYTVSIITTGNGYEIDDELIILGDTLGGLTPFNDLTITVQDVNISGSITNFSHTGTAINGLYVVSTADSNRTSVSNDGVNWSNGGNLPSSGNWRLASGQQKMVAVRFGSTAAAYSTNGTTWTATTLPASRNWRAIAYGNGQFMAIADNLNSGAISTDGETWTSITLPTAGDSTINEWIDVAYGAGKFIAIANSNNIVAISNDNGSSWSPAIIDVSDSAQVNWVGIAYGTNRFIAISSEGYSAYSFDGVTWYGNYALPKQDGSTAMNWKGISYGQGVFVAICDTGNAVIGADPTTGETDYIATTEDGLVWTGRELASSQIWSDIVFGNNNQPRWVIVAPNVSDMNYMTIGCTTKGRVIVSGSNIIQQIRIWEPGSSYATSPTLTLIDPNNTSDAVVENRIGSGVLATPSFINRGFSYSTASTRTIISGDGFADSVPQGTAITLNNVSVVPSPGTQLVFDSFPFDIYSVTTATILNASSGNNLVAFTVTPSIPIQDAIVNGTEVTIYERYSQIRITGHDFLDIGTGNFEETNYPTVDTLNEQSFNEVVETNGGRVFYTSTDQDGNFRAGELFAVEQATGVVTISSEFFDLQGLTELTLGGVRLGGSGVVIREFSTDATFTANSNNIVPTQRAIKAFLENRLSQGGSEIATSSFIAGTILVGPIQISSTINGIINFNAVVSFTGPKAIIDGSMLAQAYYHSTFLRD